MCNSTSPCPRRLVPVVLGLLILASTGPAAVLAQVPAGIVGQVTDENGGVLPGVMVTATGPSLQVPSVSDVTNAQGEYRLTPLPIGVYSVVYTLAGFQTLRREELRLTSGFVASVNVVLKIGGLEESITVSGVSPAVDVTTTALATQFTKETLELAATPRNGMWSLVAQMPQVRVNAIAQGGMTVDNPGNVTKYGQTGEDWVLVEGVASQPDSWSGVYIDYDIAEEMRLEVVGSDASVPQKGLKIQLITRSGGNDFHGGYTYGRTSSGLQSDNLTDQLRAAGVKFATKVLSRNDNAANLGGRIVRDKLWFFGALRRTNNIVSPLGALMPDGSAAEVQQLMQGATGKISYQATAGNRFIGFYTVAARHTEQMTEQTPWESRIDSVLRAPTFKFEWQHVRGSSLVTSLQYGKWAYTLTTRETTSNPATMDLITGRVSGSSTANDSDVWRHHLKANLTWFRPDLFAGNHELKGGYEYMDWSQNYYLPSRSGGDYVLIYRDGVPFQFRTVNAPVTPLNPAHHTTLYATDSWTMTRRLTLNLGLRFARDNGFAPEQCQQAGQFVAAQCYAPIQFRIWNSFAPRLHFAYGIGGDGKTVLKGGWGVYNQMRGNAPTILANLTNETRTFYTWHDLNGDRLWQPGEVNLDLNGPDFVSRDFTSNMVPNPNEIQPRTHEFTLALEREVMSNFALRVAGIYHNLVDRARLQNNKRPYDVYNIPVTNPDPGPDGRAGTADDPGTFVTYYDYPAAYRGNAFVETMYVTDPSARQTFKTIETSATKRMSNRWQMMAMYSATKKNIPYATNVAGFYPVTTLDPNAEINTADHTWDYQAGVSGAYIFPRQVTASVNYRLVSGRTFGRTVLATGGRQLTSQVVRVEPIGAQRSDTINIVDLKFDKTFAVFGSQRVGVTANLFNALNAATVVSVSDRSGPTYLLPTGTEPVLRPRVVTFDLTYRW